MMGVSGRAMLAALMAGRAEPATMAERAKRRLRSKRPWLEPALTGGVHDHHRQWLAMQLAHLDVRAAPIEALHGAMATSLKALRTAEPCGEAPPPLLAVSRAPSVAVSSPLPCPRAVELLDTIPGIAPRGADVIVAESGMEMARFATAPRLAAWAG